MCHQTLWLQSTFSQFPSVYFLPAPEHESGAAQSSVTASTAVCVCVRVSVWVNSFTLSLSLSPRGSSFVPFADSLIGISWQGRTDRVHIPDITVPLTHTHTHNSVLSHVLNLNNTLACTSPFLCMCILDCLEPVHSSATSHDSYVAQNFCFGCSCSLPSTDHYNNGKIWFVRLCLCAALF